MKTALIIITLLLIILYGGRFAVNFHTSHIARARMLSRLLSDRFNVRTNRTPVWCASEQIGNYRYCSRIYSVSINVSR